MYRNGKFSVVLLVVASFIVLSLPNRSHAQTNNSGDLAIVGNDGNIYLYDTATQNLSIVTSDARPITSGYHWPTWSTDGQLAFFGYNVQQGNIRELSMYVQAVGGTPQEVFSQTDEAFTYAYWSPADCAGATTSNPCRDLALLYTGSDGNLALRNIRVGSSVDVTELSVGGPHYWDWSPDGSTMFWGRFGTNLELFDVESGDIEGPFPNRMGHQQAVDWSPIDDRLLTSLAGPNNTSVLAILDGNDRQVLVEDLQSSVAFAWSPNGSEIAYVDNLDGKLEIIRASDGSTILTPSIEVLAFLWSPDSSKIAYLTFADSSSSPGAKRTPQNLPDLQWHIIDIATKNSAHHRSFMPTEMMLYYLNFYDQFSRSHQLWSSDSQYFAFGETLTDGTTVVSLIDTTATNNAIAAVADGTIGIFSWGN